MNTLTSSATSRSGTGSPGSLAALRQRLERLISHDLIALACRFSIAGVFWLSGRTKVEGWFTLTDTTFLLFRQDYALPLIPPEWAAYLATGAEHLLPVLLVLGLFTRVAALGVLGMTAVIQTFVYPSGWPTHLTWAAPMLYLLGRGPGRWSLDHVVGWGLERRP
ncbi:DoxX family protein [Roseateles chitinivorans]|uniref:DoxX family protein n=1 Tax=Roseateles chitinivorans TaxID=2917965 RepID=UPI003D66DBC5